VFGGGGGAACTMHTRSLIPAPHLVRALTPFVTHARDKYHLLEHFEVQVPDGQLELLDSLSGEWSKFQVCAGGACRFAG
jgi:hypothetical protein